MQLAAPKGWRLVYLHILNRAGESKMEVPDKMLNGAGVGDLFMSLIHTFELNGANPF